MNSKTKSIAISAAVLFALCSLTACSDSQEQITASIQQITTTLDTAPTKQETTETEEAKSEISSDDLFQIAEETTETINTEVTYMDIEMPDPFPEKDDDSNMLFYAPVISKLDYIDMSFIRLVDYDDAMDWVYSHSSSLTEFTSISEFGNLYTFIKDYDISAETVRDILVSMRNGSDLDFSDEEIDLITSGNDEAVAEHFASEMAIRKGSNIYSLHWIYNHSIEDYIANDITAEEIKEKLPLFEQFSLTDEAKQAIELKIKSYADFKS